jgi:chromate transporter
MKFATKGLADLFLTFARIGAVSFGGGYAMLPALQREIVDKKHWSTEKELIDCYAIGQCTPGAIAVNTATFIGYQRAGIAGGIAATLGIITPPVLIITLLAHFLTHFAKLPLVMHAFAGIRVCVTVLILDSVVRLGKRSVVDLRCALVFLVILALSLLTSISPALLVILSGIAGFLLYPGSTKGGADA